jgi:hypothetical protein
MTFVKTPSQAATPTHRPAPAVLTYWRLGRKRENEQQADADTAAALYRKRKAAKAAKEAAAATEAG